MRAFLLVYFFLTSPFSVTAQESFKHELFDRVLRGYVDERGLVDYVGLQGQSQDLESYVALIGKHSPDNSPGLFPSPDARLAYWINAYNALALYSVVQAYPVKSVKEIKWFYGFFNRIKHLVGGQKYTLKHIEHEIVRKRFPDPRIHVGLNCASMGCPTLPPKAFESQQVIEDLDAHMYTFLSESRNVRVDYEKETIFLSEILNEFQADFTSWYEKEYEIENATIIDYLKLFLPQRDKEFLAKHPSAKIEYVAYDWRLNDQEISR
jgi:hypothetical protein